MTETFTPSALANRDSDRMRAYRDNLDFYNGSQWLGSGRERRLVFNYARVNVDKVTSYLMGGFGFAVDPIGDVAKDQARAAEVALRQVYEANDLRQLDYEAEVDAAVLGDGCYKVTFNQETKQVRVTAPDVTGLHAWRAGDDINQVWRVASRYKLSKDEVSTLYGVDIATTAAWITELWTAAQFTIYLDDAVIQDGPNPYGFIPFILFPNVRRPQQAWGESDIPAMTEAQRELNRAISQLSRILELSGNPIAVLENVEASAGIKVQPGAVWNLPEDAKAYLLDLLKGGGTRLHIEYIDLLYRCMHDLAESPRAAFGGIEQELSGVALEVELHSLLQKVARKRNIRTSVYKRRNEAILRLLSRFGGEGYGSLANAPLHHRIVWGSVVPQDKARAAQNEQLLVVSGIHSRKRGMDELGIEDPEAEFAAWLEERRAIMTQNKELNARSTRGGPRERATSGEPTDDTP